MDDAAVTETGERRGAAPPWPADLNAPLRALRAAHMPSVALAGHEVAPGVHLRLDPAAWAGLRLQSPRGRLLEIEARFNRPGEWFGLHIPLDLPDLAGAVWVGFALRAASGRAMALRACLRSGLAAGGFHDQFMDRDVMVRPWQDDHHDLLAPAHALEMPLLASWREFVLFLPPDRDFSLSLHELRIFVL